MDRLPCLVPFCRRTTKLKYEGEEWLCSTHWLSLPVALRRRKTKWCRRYTKRFGRNAYWCYPAGSENRIAALRLAKVCDRIWERCKQRAIERATGIG